MVASTDIKWFVHTNNNAPQLSNSWGVMIDVLDACLINGITIGTVSTLTASGTSVTATFGTAHGVQQYQVIQISGANQAEYNGEHCAIEVTSTTITFELASAPSVTTATGTITAKIASAGWEKSFSGTNKAAYRSLNTLLPSRPYLRVDNSLDPVYTTTYAKYAKVGIVETMTDIDTMSGVQAPYDSALPDKNWVGTGSGSSAINGWAKWYYARGSSFASGADSTSPAEGSRAWVLVATTDVFYIFPAVSTSANESVVYGFGSFSSLIPSDNSNVFLSASSLYVAANNTTSKSGGTPLGTTSSSALLIQRKYDQTTVSSTASATSIMGGQSSISTGAANVISAPATQGNIPFSPVYIYETGNVLRGTVPLLNWLFQDKPYSDLQRFIENSQVYLAKLIYPNNGASLGQIVIKIGSL